MEADDVNWDPIFEMMPTQDMDDYEDRMKSVDLTALRRYCV